MGFMVDGNFYEAAADGRAPSARPDSSSCAARPLGQHHHREAFNEGVERRRAHGLAGGIARAEAGGRTMSATFMPHQQPAPHPALSTVHQGQQHRPAGSFERRADFERGQLHGALIRQPVVGSLCSIPVIRCNSKTLSWVGCSSCLFL